jgi:hypothetical protein
MEDIRTIINSLGPGTGQQLFWDIALYWLFFINPKNGIYDNDPQTCHAKVFIGTYLIRVVMFAGPFAVAGSTSKGKVRAVGILAGLSAVIYMLGRWYFEQRDFKTSTITCENTGVVIQSVGMILVLAKIALRDRLPLGSIHRHVPVAIARDAGAHDIRV